MRSSRSTTRASSRDAGPVLGSDDPVDDEGAEEGQARLTAARDCEVVVAPEVRHRPAAEQREGHAGERQRASDPNPPTTREEERDDRNEEERLVDGPGQGDERGRRPERGEAPPRGRQHGAHGKRRPDREPRGEDDLARELVEEHAVPGIEEERGRGEHGRPGPEEQRGARMEQDRASEEQGGDDLDEQPGCRGRGFPRRRAARRACARASPTGRPRRRSRSRRRRRRTTRGRAPAPSASRGPARRRPRAPKRRRRGLPPRCR